VVDTVTQDLIVQFEDGLVRLGLGLVDSLHYFKELIENLGPLLLNVRSINSLMVTPILPLIHTGADNLNKRFQDVFFVSDQSERSAAIETVMSACQHNIMQAMGGAASIRPHHEALMATLSATNTFLNAVESVFEVFEATMLDVCTGLNSARASADVILDATAKSETLIAAVKNQLRPVRDEVLRVHTAAESQLGRVQATHNQLRSLGEILQHWDASWKAQASSYSDTPASSAWYAKTLPFNVQDWPIATAVTMSNVRKQRFQPRENIQSPFAILPGYLRALGPHQGEDWWNFGLDTRHDLLALRTAMIFDDRYAKNGAFKRYTKLKEVRCLIYNFDTSQYTAEDVVAFILDELHPRTDGSNPLLDIRVVCMTSYL
jgi:hypothetical protein